MGHGRRRRIALAFGAFCTILLVGIPFAIPSSTAADATAGVETPARHNSKQKAQARNPTRSTNDRVPNTPRPKTDRSSNSRRNQPAPPSGGKGSRRNSSSKANQSPPLSAYGVWHDVLNMTTAALWFVAYVVLLSKVRAERSAWGLSFQTLFALMLVEINNTSLILCLSRHFSKRLLLEFYFIDFSSAIFTASSYLYIATCYSSSYDRDSDGFGRAFIQTMRNILGNIIPRAQLRISSPPAVEMAGRQTQLAGVSQYDVSGSAVPYNSNAGQRNRYAEIVCG
eukprot:GHVT01078798.1.p1 GENE.GHVT01078798.1~~GHVT01078798.1.p1  ORF type:complete len:282 (+),score=23.44 GHVT01078798.1:1250-2095(+)